jgi:putative inorganic carbon (HCO3(-)) transporter
MHLALRALDRRTLAVLAAGMLTASAVGLVAGRWPVIAIAGAGALAIAAVMFKDLALGVAVFTIGSFAGVLSSGSASASKGLGLLLVLAWAGILAMDSGRRQVRSLMTHHRGLVACGVGLVAWSVLSAAWAQSPSTALSGASRWAQDLALFPIVFTALRRLPNVRSVAIAFVAGALLSIAYGLMSGHTYADSRLGSALDDPNETAAVAVAASVLAISLGAAASGWGRRSVAFAAAVAGLAGLAATASRGGLIALAVAAITAVAFAGRWRRRVGSAAAIGAVLVIGWFVLLAPASSRSHVTNAQTGRTTLWTVAERAIAANPVVGVGNDNFAQTAKNYLVQPGVTTNAVQVVSTPHVAHNVYLEIWADLGIIGLVLFAGLVLCSFRAALATVKLFERAGHRAGEILARGVVVAIVALLAADLFISDQYSKQLFLLLALSPAMWAAARAEVSRR